ncbi:hypothetical protein V6N13_106805 [Hibiscus sabdariffa]
MIKEIPEIHWRVQKLRLGGQENDEYQWRLGRQGLQGKAPARFRYWRAYESKMTLRNQRLVLHHHRYPRKKKKKKKISTIRLFWVEVRFGLVFLVVLLLDPSSLMIPWFLTMYVWVVLVAFFLVISFGAQPDSTCN